MRVPNIHFEPESRQLQRARLEHLLSFSDLLMLLIAEQGLGKTQLLLQLKPQQNPMQPSWVYLAPESAFDVTHLLQALVSQLGVSCEPNNRARLTALHAYARELEQFDQQLHICIDDADYLSDNALELLINFSKVDSAAPKVLLAGLPEFEQRFFEREFNRLVEGSLHVEHLQPFTAEEARAFIDAHLLDGGRMKDAEYRRLLLESHGRPDLLKAALAKLLDRVADNTGLRRAATNRWYWGGIALVLTTTLAALGYLYAPNETPEPQMTRPLEIPIPQVVPANRQSETELLAARTELAERLAAQEKRLAQVELGGESVPVPTVAEPEVQIAPQPEAITEVEPESAPEPEMQSVTEEPVQIASPTEPEAATVTQPSERTDESRQLPPGAELEQPEEQEAQSQPQASVVAAKPKPKSEPPQPPMASQEPGPVAESRRFGAGVETVLGWPATDLTIQLLAAREEQSADKLIAKFQGAAPLLKLTYPYKGAPRYTVVMGHYASRAAANQGVAALPAELQRLQPWIRSVAGLKAELNSALNP